MTRSWPSPEVVAGIICRKIHAASGSAAIPWMKTKTTMKKILTATLIAAIVATASIIIQAEERTFPEKTHDAIENAVEKTKDAAHDTKVVIKDAARHAGKSTRAAWSKTKAFFSEDKTVYHAGAGATLAGLEREIAVLKARASSETPVYFRTRVVALTEQHEYLISRLEQLLDAESLKIQISGPRHDFNRCLNDLEAAIDQAED